MSIKAHHNIQQAKAMYDMPVFIHMLVYALARSSIG